MSYKLIFANGAEVENLSMNATTLVSEKDVSDLLADEEAMKEVRLIETDDDGNETETIYRYAQTSGAYKKEDGWNFTIWGASADEIKFRELREDMETALNELVDFVIGGEE